MKHRAAALAAAVLLLSGCSSGHDLVRGPTPPPGDAKRGLLLADHVTIYGLIVGTFTPLALVPAGGRIGWEALALVWALGAAGAAAKVARSDRLGHAALLARGTGANGPRREAASAR